MPVKNLSFCCIDVLISHLKRLGLARICSKVQNSLYLDDSGDKIVVNTAEYYRVKMRPLRPTFLLQKQRSELFGVNFLEVKLFNELWQTLAATCHCVIMAEAERPPLARRRRAFASTGIVFPH